MPVRKRSIAALFMLVSLLVTASCGAPTPVVEEVEKTVVVEKEVEVEKTVVVEKTVEVEKEVVVTATPDEATEEEMSAVQELRVIIEPISAAQLDPLIWGWWRFSALLWAPLLGLDENEQAVPTGLATDWDVSEDGLVYTFHLREDAKFSDGSPITAEDVKWSFDHWAMLAHPDHQAVRNNYGQLKHVSQIVGAQKWLTGEGVEATDLLGTGDLEGITVIDEYTLQMELTIAAPGFLPTLARLFYVANPEDIIAGRDKEYGEDNWWTTEPDCSYSGPFKLESFSPGQGYTMVPNDQFWGEEPMLNKFIVSFAPDEATALAAFENKEADVVAMYTSGDMLRQALTSDYMASSLRGLGTGDTIAHLWVTPFKPMDDVHVRRAVSMAIDKDTLINVLNGGAEEALWTRTNGRFAISHPACTEEKEAVEPLPFDPELAKEELAKSAYADTIQDMEINIVQWDSDDAVLVETVHRMLQENLGLNVQIRTEEIPDWSNPPYPAHMWPNVQGGGGANPVRWIAIYANRLHCEPPSEDEMIGLVTVPCVPEFEALGEAASAVTTLEDACPILGEGLQMWEDNAMSIPYGIQPFGYLVAPWVKNLRLSGTDKYYPWLKPGIEEVWIAKH